MSIINFIYEKSDRKNLLSLKIDRNLNNYGDYT